MTQAGPDERGTRRAVGMVVPTHRPAVTRGPALDPSYYHQTTVIAIEQAIDNFLSNVESLTIALSQRQLSGAQRERYACILQRAERTLLVRRRKRVA